MIRLMLIDGPLPRDHPALDTRHDFRDGTANSPAGRHASALAEAALSHAPALRIVNLVVFGASLATDAATVARALAAEETADADLVLCAFGLARDDPTVRAAVARLTAGGTPVVAAAAARGAPVHPAALPGVNAVQGDARCGPGDWSALAPGLWGACPVASSGVRGASAAAAHFTGHLASRLNGAYTASRLTEALAAAARFTGRERRTG